MQLSTVGADKLESVTTVAPIIFLLASAGAKHRNRKSTAEGPFLEDVEPTHRAVAPHKFVALYFMKLSGPCLVPWLGRC